MILSRLAASAMMRHSLQLETVRLVDLSNGYCGRCGPRPPGHHAFKVHGSHFAARPLPCLFDTTSPALWTARRICNAPNQSREMSRQINAASPMVAWTLTLLGVTEPASRNQETKAQKASGQAKSQAKRMRLRHIGRSLVSQSEGWDCVREEQPSGAHFLVCLALMLACRLGCACGVQRHSANNNAFTVQIRAVSGWQPRGTGVPGIAGLRCNGGQTGSRILMLLLWVDRFDVTIRENSTSSCEPVARKTAITSYAAC